MKKVFLFLLVSTTFIIGQTIPFPVDTIVRNERFNNREFPAYDSQGKIHLTYTGQVGTDGSTREIYYVKEEANGTFTTTNITNNLVDDNYSSLSIDPGGTAHVGYLGRDGNNVFQVQYKNNSTGVFGSPIFLTSGSNAATPVSKIGPDSVVHFVFFTFTNDPDNIFYTFINFKDSSILLTPMMLAAGETGGDFDAHLDIDHNGKVHIVMKTGSALGGQLKYFNSVGGGLGEVPTGVTATITNPKVLIDNNNKVHILYRNESDLRLYIINNVSGSFSTPQAVTPVGQRPAFAQNFAMDDNGRIYIVYQSSVAQSGRGFYFIWGQNNVYSDTMLIYDLTSEYVTRNSSAIIAKGDGDIAMFYAPGGVRNSQVICDIFLRRGNLSQIVPVELVSFNASVSNDKVVLSWITATEINNRGFEVERRQVFSLQSSVGNEDWEVLGFVEGKGTTTEQQVYSFIDENISAERYMYRLKQIDYDGSYEYSKVVEVDLSQPITFSLEQNYPNPFNPETKIKFTIPSNVKGEMSNVKLMVYDVLGNEIATLVNEEKPAGSYEVTFDGKGLSSGMYFYSLQSGSFSKTNKMMLVK